MIKKLWMKIPLNWRKEITSALITFVVSFVISMSEVAVAGQDRSWAFLLATASVAFRYSLKVLVKEIMLFIEREANNNK